MADEIYDSTRSGTAKENIPTMSNPMDNIHGNVEDISNRASGYKVMRASFLPPSFFLSPPPPPPSTDATERGELIMDTGRHA